MRANGGFTLIELILVVVIIGILAGAVVTQFSGQSENARIQRARHDIVSYQDAIDLYAIENNDKYPASLNALVTGKKKYVRKIQKDPWGNDYVYVLPGKHNREGYDIYSRGPDGVADTADDITSWGD